MSAKSGWALDKTDTKIATHAGTGAHLVRKKGDVQTQRFRVTIAQINAGFTLLAALSGFKYRLIDCLAIAIGGAVAAVTTVDLLGTQAAASVKLLAFAQAQLTQSTVNRPGVTGTAVLADGDSFEPCDNNTAITVGKTGDDVTTATHVDFVLSYAIDET